MHQAVVDLSTCCVNLSVHAGEFQADSVIQRMLVKKEADIVLGNDADFSFIAGPACLQVKYFKHRMQKKTRGAPSLIHDITVATAFKPTIAECCSWLNINMGEAEPTKTGPIFQAAKVSMLDGITDVRTWCLIAVALGNDTMPTKLKRNTFFNGLSPRHIRDVLVSLRASKSLPAESNVEYDGLLSAIIVQQTPKIGRQLRSDRTILHQNTISAFVDAMAYEPAR